MSCGAKIATKDAVQLYVDKHGDTPEPAPAKPQFDVSAQAQFFIDQGNFDAAEHIYMGILTHEPDDPYAHWGLVRARTKNLEPVALKTPEDFVWADAQAAFKSKNVPEVQEWRDAYYDAYEKSCYMTVDAVDYRVFVELEIYKWYPQGNTFLYPIYSST